MVVTLCATLYYLLHEPEDGVVRLMEPRMQNARTIAFWAAVLGAVSGVATILWRDGRRNLFAMAVLFNVIVGSFWLMRSVMGV